MKSVLLVEDDPQLTLAMGVRLKSMGYQVTTAADAVMAVGQARRCEPDVVVIDVNLPGGDGFVVAERLHALHQTSTVPIVMMTASKKPGLADRARDVGAIAFLEKPFDAAQLSNAIEQASYAESPFRGALD